MQMQYIPGLSPTLNQQQQKNIKQILRMDFEMKNFYF